MNCTYRFKGAGGEDITITGKAAMMAALADGRLDRLLPAGTLPAMQAAPVEIETETETNDALPDTLNAGNAGSASGESPDTGSAAPGITADTLQSTFAQRFPSLAGAVTTMLDRGARGMRRGLVVLDTNDSAEIAREYADRAGWEVAEVQKLFESVDGAGVNGLFDPKSGLTFAIGPNLSPETLPGVVLHEALHGQQRKDIDAKALALIDGRAKEAPALRAFLDRVAERMEHRGGVLHCGDGRHRRAQRGLLGGGWPDPGLDREEHRPEGGRHGARLRGDPARLGAGAWRAAEVGRR